MKNSNRLFVVALFLFSGPALASNNIKDVYHYMDMDCQKLMHKQTDDEFQKFVRNEIKLSIGEHFCELVEEDPALQADVEYEAQRDYISMADYSKIIDMYYSSYHNRRP